MVKCKLANWCGFVSAAINVLFWVLVLNPFGLKGFPHDIEINFLAILLSLIGSIVAAVKASRWWFVSTLVSLATFGFLEYSLR
jgi:hypothetical protein